MVGFPHRPWEPVSRRTTRMNTRTRSEEKVKNLSLYQEFQAQREEILRHKWIESEKAGHDIGFEKALVDWMVNHRAGWKSSRQARRA